MVLVGVDVFAVDFGAGEPGTTAESSSKSSSLAVVGDSGGPLDFYTT